MRSQELVETRGFWFILLIHDTGRNGKSPSVDADFEISRNGIVIFRKCLLRYRHCRVGPDVGAAEAVIVVKKPARAFIVYFAIENMTDVAH